MTTEDIKKMVLDFMQEEEGAAEATAMDVIDIDNKPTADLIQDWMDINDTCDKWVEEIDPEEDYTADDIDRARGAILELIDIEIDMRHNH